MPDTLVEAITARLSARRQARFAAPTASASRAQQAPTDTATRGATATGFDSAVAPPAQKAGGKIPEIGPGAADYKDPSTATIFGLLITGAGHIYAGEGGTGALLLLGSVAAVGIGAGASDVDRGDYSPLYVGIGVAAVLGLVSIFDAAPAAHRHNRRAARALGMGAVEPIFSSTSDGSRVGLRISLGGRRGGSRGLPVVP